MAKIKLSKGELKRQRDALRQYGRYLPVLQLKKQQLQLEILRQLALLEGKEHHLATRKQAAETWAGLLSEALLKQQWLVPEKVMSIPKNIAGVDIPVFQRVEFGDAEYDLFLMPLWLDAGLEALRQMVALTKEIALFRQGIGILRQELCITTQRVNLFEKVKIPAAQEAIRVIKIFIGDQMTNAVGRSKIAKAKTEEAAPMEAAL